MPEVSVIIPVYNNEKFIEKCIRSVMEQSFCDLEILVVNDGSTDGRAEILQKLAGEDGRIREWQLPETVALTWHPGSILRLWMGMIISERII